ncbi:MAG: 16S rRNA (cytidine(1402)-2'-O)-methyltransferase [Armatimonadetes bacterium]|nr:16S rRNA (cytidine(1402)-2'-O)-methyltransferase [Armatimonadota bacterium]
MSFLIKPAIPAKPPPANESGMLWVVATPIGNLEDITLRALRMLREADLIAAEDTRVTRKLLSHYDIHTPLVSYHKHSSRSKVDRLCDLLREGRRIALVTDAGTPGLSDPGAELIKSAICAGVPISPIPGVSSIIAALSVSNVNWTRFAFDGFPPRGRSDRREFFSELANERRAIVLFESAERILSTLDELDKVLPGRQAIIARELTKYHEEIFSGTIKDAKAKLSATPPKGELTIVIAPPDLNQKSTEADPVLISRLIQEQLQAGMTLRDAVNRVSAQLAVSRSLVYRIGLSINRNQNPTK